MATTVRSVVYKSGYFRPNYVQIIHSDIRTAMAVVSKGVYGTHVKSR